MPDLITHLAFSHLVIRGFEWLKKETAFTPFRVLFYAGTILPDVRFAQQLSCIVS